MRLEYFKSFLPYVMLPLTILNGIGLRKYVHFIELEEYDLKIHQNA